MSSLDVYSVFNRVVYPTTIFWIIHQKLSYHIVSSFFTYPHFYYSCFIVLICTMGKGIECFSKYNWLKLSTTKLKKPVLSSLYFHTSSASNYTRTPIWYHFDNNDITSNQNKNNTSHTDDMHWCITPRKRVIVFRPHV